MSSVQRVLDGDVLVHHLRRDEQTIDTVLLEKHGRTARTLVKEGSLRLTLMALAPSNVVPIHKAEGPISVQVLQGDVVFTAAGADYPLEIGDFIVVAAGVDHSLRSEQGCRLLLTVVHPPAVDGQSQS
jgi:quercetin dioxygenase-like cupin family protein